MITIVGVLRPQDIDAGEGPLRAVGIGLMVGFVSGTVFGILLAIGEHRKSLSDLRLLRIAAWGIVAASTFPLLTAVDNRMLYIFCPLGALWAAISVVMARRASADPAHRSAVGRLLAEPIEAALGANV
jgi:hypothetical protein